MSPGRFANFVAAILVAAQTETTVASAAADTGSLLGEADAKMASRAYEDAIRLYKKAIKGSDDGCAPCQMSLSKAYHVVGNLKDALESAEAAIALLERPAELAAAWNQKAIVEFAAAGQEPDRLRRAERSFRKVLELDDKPIVRYSLGVTLMRLNEDAAGIAELERFLLAEPGSPKAKAARDMIENPRRARESMLPSLELRTLDGRRLTNADLEGKVVLLDFWATWCAPCRASVPSLRALVERTAKSPLVVVSVSVDENEGALRAFLTENNMTWTQVWDPDRIHTRDLSVPGFPTYLLADHEGVVVFRHSGWGDAVERAIEIELRRAVSKAKRAAAN